MVATPVCEIGVRKQKRENKIIENRKLLSNKKTDKKRFNQTKSYTTAVMLAEKKGEAQQIVRQKQVKTNMYYIQWSRLQATP